MFDTKQIHDRAVQPIKPEPEKPQQSNVRRPEPLPERDPKTGAFFPAVATGGAAAVRGR